LLKDADDPLLDDFLLLGGLGRADAAVSLGSSTDLARRFLSTDGVRRWDAPISLATEPLGNDVLVSGARSGVVGARAVATSSALLSCSPLSCRRRAQSASSVS